MDCRGRGRQAALQDLEGETDIVAASGAVFSQTVCTIHLFAHIMGYGFVEFGFAWRQIVGDGVGATLRKQRAAVEPVQFLLGQAAHHVRGIDLADAFPEAPFETISVEKAHEKLEILFLAVVRRRRHQQKMAGEAASQSTQLVALGVSDLLAEKRRRHAVGLVAHDQVPGRRGFQPGFQVVVAGKHVESGNQAGSLCKGIAGHGRFGLLAAHDVEGEIEFVIEFVLPLFDQTPGRDDQASFQAAANQQFLDQQAGHDSLPGARIVGQQETQRLAIQHRTIDCGDLVRQRLDLRGIDGDIGIEEIRETDTQRLRNETKQASVSVKSETARRSNFAEVGLVFPIEDALAKAVRPLPGDLDRVGAVGTRGDDFHRAIAQNTSKTAAGNDAFKFHHDVRIPASWRSRHRRLRSGHYAQVTLYHSMLDGHFHGCFQR